MASAPLNYLAFLLGRSTENDATRSNPDPVGFFYCRASTARFLDIEKLAFTGQILTKRKAHARTKTLADGTTLGGTDAEVAESTVARNAKSRGNGKNVKLVTGKKTAKGNYQTISFNFPSFATSQIIGEALGELIPSTKIKASATAADIFPYFILPSGGRGGIMKKEAAVASTKTEVPLTAAQQRALLKKKDAENDVQEGAGEE
ncbi:hypothetical protein VF06_37440 [Nostoc linckia z4]|uniref:Uncharacterized protein n=1 Tax=Nostoc linckia z8 TaxID=1628746 RepID=A0A9Q5ZAZ4_NOSLI|nr:hypothetical protein [Nostoc linckia]PHJ54504.1 hypothetical protein VF02_36600 [Nostoc linckia z1]PHJ69408.1 hypothetical protein VF03_24015 [Nostoc linckia z2]PHJ70857.1 hypothetical protein VF06_37440 [Nostoc linckia z4]PHJ79674.1 hypothetical protein VF07_33360 [Nostoc linckia z6]PHK02499.1 hypothetical protein VF08_18360 [Nostoc linckia z8]